MADSSLLRRGVWVTIRLWLFKLGRWLRKHKRWNTLKQLNWIVIGLAILTFSLGVAGIVNGPYEYPFGNPRIFQSRLSIIHKTVAEELFGIGATVFTIDVANRMRQIREDKRRLIRQMRSSDNGLALQAAEELKIQGRHRDGSLNKAWLVEADLQGVQFESESRLQGIQTASTNMKRAYLYKADLKGASLSDKFQQATLIGANLKGARVSANLQGAYMNWANLWAADLSGANFKGIDSLTEAQLLGANKLAFATMPDGSRYDGRFNLKGDVETLNNWLAYGQASIADQETLEIRVVDIVYGLPIETYREGQEWAQQFLDQRTQESLEWYETSWGEPNGFDFLSDEFREASIQASFRELEESLGQTSGEQSGIRPQE